MVSLPVVGNPISGTALTVYFFCFLARAHVQSQLCHPFRGTRPNRICFSPYFFCFWNPVSWPWYLLLSSCIDAPPPPCGSLWETLHTYTGIRIARVRMHVHRVQFQYRTQWTTVPELAEPGTGNGITRIASSSDTGPDERPYRNWQSPVLEMGPRA